MTTIINNYLMEKMNVPKTELTEAIDKHILRLTKMKDTEKNAEDRQRLTKGVEHLINKLNI